MEATPPITKLDNEHHPSSHVIGVRFEKLGKLYHFDYTGYEDINANDYVVVETARGQHIGQVMGFAERDDENQQHKPMLRLASGRDLLLLEQWKKRGVETIIDCREMAANLGGFKEVKFVEAEYNFDGSYLTIMYSTEEDVEVGQLRETLQEHVGIDTEFRRIGPREVARRLGGQGACGIPRCCSTFLTDFSPISIKMAKAQGIPLNPSEITGMCGRLRCCLIYEYEQYVEARKQLPKRNKLIGTPFGELRVADVHPLKDGISIYVEKQRHFVAREDIIPLDEFRALKDKAAAGCSKNESGGCDCGTHRPKSATGDLKVAMDMAETAASGTIEPPTDEATADGPMETSAQDQAGNTGEDSSQKDEDRKSNRRGGGKKRTNRRNNNKSGGKKRRRFKGNNHKE